MSRLVEIPTSGQKLHAYFVAGYGSRDWYTHTFEELQDIFGDDTGLFIDLLAATSANTALKSNVTLALKAYRMYREYQEVREYYGYVTAPLFPGFLPIIQRMLINIWEGRGFGGPKIQAFRLALLGRNDAVVVDTWMLRAFGFPNVTDARIRAITDWITRKAARVGLEPRQVQAAIWCGIKKLEGKPGHTSDTYQSLLAPLNTGELP